MSLNDLPNPNSRMEKYLAYMNGKEKDLNNLPKPMSRIDEYLYHLCTNWNNSSSEFEEENVEKYFIIAVAGQSNAVGYDESVVSSIVSKNINENRIKQLGLYEDDNLKVIPLGHCAQSFQDMRNMSNPNSLNFKGTKGLHLPLGNLLLKHIPEEYKIVFLPVAYGGTGFNSGKVGTYDQNTMKPSSGALKWSDTSPYFLAFRDRLKYLLDLNQDNIFGGVIWIQGENDKTNASTHKAAFERMTNTFFEYFNNNGYENRVKKGVWDKDIWYNVETVSYWYLQGQCKEIWENYKNWNPNTYVDIPRDTETNAVNGTGVTSSTRQSHFGNNAYQKVVAPRIVEKMLVNNALFNNDNEISNTKLSKLNYDTTENAISKDISLTDITKTNTAEVLTLENGIISVSPNPSGYPSRYMFDNNTYKIEFEVTRGIYWFIYKGDINTKFSMIGLGAMDRTHNIADVTVSPSNALTVKYTGKNFPNLQYDFIDGDKIAIYRNTDGTFSFYINKKDIGKYVLWFKFNPREYPTESSDTPLFGFIEGISGGEALTGYNLGNLFKNAVIQKEQGFNNNDTLDTRIYNTVQDILKKFNLI
ncbi:hypothetical protein NSA50_19625 [Clostridium sp. DSM 100503]|uniref:hypothetical protein n=1 Tax=Clostridium sp. DSM 100503 TaxID=2963282 RepID=UPI002149EEA9|nr:hypothetical protein [Clostridium sp. DSM 100503]MCR1953199.1 hypothetical protein [Clostridium sp. DSM 100503]